MLLRHARGVLELAEPAVMGVLNVTPDSFSDGGQFLDPALALEHALQLRADGAAIIDIGGESTRPGAAAVSEDVELARVLPLVQRLTRDSGILISVDTSSPLVMRAVIDAGAVMINDVRALQRPGALTTVAATRAALCLMHMQGEPDGMQRAPSYRDAVSEVGAFLQARVLACQAAGIDRDRIVIDPGFGFGKSTQHNLQLLARLGQLNTQNCVLLAGLSRKSMLQSLTGRAVNERLHGSLALATIAVLNGAMIIRAHDVAATLDVIRVAAAVRKLGVNN
jgi:dihydropteroate synthase